MEDTPDGFPLIRIRNYLRDRTLEGLEGTDLKTNHVPFLITVLDRPGISLTELSRCTGLDKSTVARNIQQLSDMGYVNRVGDPKRSNTVYLTDRGREAAEDVAALNRAVMGDILSCLSPGEATELHRLVGRIVDHIGDRGY